MQKPESEVKASGTPVSYISRYDGTGFGHITDDLPPDTVLISGGNGYFYSEPVKLVIKDAGARYRKHVKEAGLDSFFQADREAA